MRETRSTISARSSSATQPHLLARQRGAGPRATGCASQQLRPSASTPRSCSRDREARQLAQRLGALAETVELGQRLRRAAPRRARARAVDAEHAHQRAGLVRVRRRAGRRRSGRRGRPPRRSARSARERPPPRRRRAARRRRSRPRTAPRSCARARTRCARRRARCACRCEVVDLAADQLQRAGGLARDRAPPPASARRRVARTRPRVSASKAAREQRVARQHGRRLAVDDVHGRAPAPRGVVVHARQVVVDQRVGVHELDGDRAAAARGSAGRRPPRPRRARAPDAVACRPGRAGGAWRRAAPRARRTAGGSAASSARVDERQRARRDRPADPLLRLLGLLERTRDRSSRPRAPALRCAARRPTSCSRAAAREPDAGLEGAQRVLEREVALLEPLDDRLELLESGLEGGPVGGFGRRLRRVLAADWAGGVSDLRRTAMQRAMLPAALGSVNGTRAESPGADRLLRPAAARARRARRRRARPRRRAARRVARRRRPRRGARSRRRSRDARSRSRARARRAARASRGAPASSASARTRPLEARLRGARERARSRAERARGARAGARWARARAARRARARAAPPPRRVRAASARRARSKSRASSVHERTPGPAAPARRRPKASARAASAARSAIVTSTSWPTPVTTGARRARDRARDSLAVEARAGPRASRRRAPAGSTSILGLRGERVERGGDLELGALALHARRRDQERDRREAPRRRPRARRAARRRRRCDDADAAREAAAARACAPRRTAPPPRAARAAARTRAAARPPRAARSRAPPAAGRRAPRRRVTSA